VPITEALAKRLKGRTGILLKMKDGKPWVDINLARHFIRVMERVTFNNPDRATMYALRQTSIVRQLPLLVYSSQYAAGRNRGGITHHRFGTWAIDLQYQMMVIQSNRRCRGDGLLEIARSAQRLRNIPSRARLK
jgi:hypothetical protein